MIAAIKAQAGAIAQQNWLMQASGRELNTIDRLITPQLSEFGYIRFTRLPVMLARGVQAAEAVLPEIRQALHL